MGKDESTTVEEKPKVIKKKLDAAQTKVLTDIYGDKAEYEYAQELIQGIDDDLDLREQSSIVFNGMSYTKSYEVNQRIAINYAPARNPKDDRQLSMGLPHEKIIAFAAIFLKFVFRKEIKCYDNKGRLIKGLGELYELAIEYSYKLEQFVKKIALIYWEVFSQGNAFVLEEWEVVLRNIPKAYMEGEKGKKGELVNADNMDYTYEFLDTLTFEEGDDKQFRRAVSRVLDGRNVIFGDPEIEEVQDQPRITIEDEVSMIDAEEMFGTLDRWVHVPKTREDITAIIGEKLTLFSTARIKDPEKRAIIHYVYNIEANRLNIFVNGLMMMSRKVPMSIFYPRMKYPLSNVPGERLKGSIYARSTPAKTKFNADFIDWALGMLANKFEQGIDPAILSQSKYTLTRDMFRGGQVTHGVKKGDYEKADPDNKGITNAEAGFVGMLKEIIDSQTLGATTTGELSSGATAFEISTVESNQRDKLGYLLDGLMIGFMDMAQRRTETIEAKYTIKQRETMVDSERVNVYQNFTIDISGVENVVIFDDNVGSINYDEQGNKDKLFNKAFKDKKAGSPTEYYLVDPKSMRRGDYNVVITVKPERIKDSQIQMIQMWDDFTQLLNTFGKDTEGGTVNMKDLQKRYLEISGQSDKTFTTKIYEQLQEVQGQENPLLNKGSFGKPASKVLKPRVKEAVEAEARK